MAFDKKKGRSILEQTIKFDLRHRDYVRVNELREIYTKFITGIDVHTLLKRFNPRETLEAFKQRTQLTQLTTMDITNSINIPLYKIGRSHANYSLNWKSEDKAEAKRKELTTVLNNFYGDESVDAYLTHKMADLDSTDSNAFIVVEFSGEYDPNKPEQTAVKPYPFEVSSEEAINYKYINNELQFLIVLLKITGVDGKGTEVPLNKFTQYLEDVAIVATQIHKDNLQNFKQQNPKVEIWLTEPDKPESSLYYAIEEFEHKAGRIPARRVGTKKDTSTRDRTCVPMMHPAYAYLMKAVKTVSEFDLTNCLHVFQKLVQYDEVCPGDVKKKIICNVGKGPDGKDCSVCEGSGWKNHKSSSDIIRVKLPKDPKDLVSLNNYMAYFAPQMELLKFQKDFGLYELKELAVKSVYASDIYVSDTTAATATEKNIELDSVYDTLKPYADNWSAMRKHITYCTAAYRNLSTDLEVVHAFPKDFKMETLTMLLDYLSKLNTSGAPAYLKKGMTQKISEKMFVDKPMDLLAISVKERYFPFNGKTESEINNIILNDLTTQYNLVLYANFEKIFQELEDENNTEEVNFYNMEKKLQKEKLDEKVAALQLVIDKEATAKRATSFNPGIGG